MDSQNFVKNLLTVLPYWHSIFNRALKRSLTEKMSLEAYYCLSTLRKSGPLTMSELARRLGTSRQQMTQLIGRLYEHDFVRRTSGETDRRYVKIEITDQAQDYIDRVYYQDTALMRQLEARLGREELEELGSAVEILMRILPKLGTPGEPGAERAMGNAAGEEEK